MLAIGLIKGEAGVKLLKIPKPQIKKPNEVLIRVKEVGIDGTDFNIISLNLQDIPARSKTIVLGHEMVGVVEDVGKEVKNLKAGDIVVATVRRGCGLCHPCLHNQSDMCMTGLYTERGIHKKDGFLTEYVVDEDQYIVKVPSSIASLAVLVEPLSIAEKGMEQIKIMQNRLPWSCPHPQHDFTSAEWGGCKTALVVGAGPLGLMATALLKLAGVNTFTSDILPSDTVRPQLVKQMEAKYINAVDKTPDEVAQICNEETKQLDIIFEAAGAAKEAVELINYMSRSSIYVMTGIPRKELTVKINAAQMVRRIVRYNQVIVGSVNSNRQHFEMAVNDIPKIDKGYRNIFRKMITHRYKMRDYMEALNGDMKDRIKTVIEIDPW
jgi:threonine dehydrogenase-like Zn-dependent dehydrogenase